MAEESDYNSWFKKNVLGATPILGHFFTKETTSKAIEYAGRETLGLSASTLMMLFHVIEEQEGSALLFFTLAGKMSLGMLSGRVIFNIGLSCYESCSEGQEPLLPGYSQTL